MYDAINRGWRRAKGEILAYLNCDEQYLPGGLSAVEEFFRRRPQTDVVFADTVVVDLQGRRARPQDEGVADGDGRYRTADSR